MGLQTFFSDLSQVEFSIPDKTKFRILAGITAATFILIFILKNSVRSQLFKENYTWFFGLVIFNLINLTLAVYYYSAKTGKYYGRPGIRGKRGMKGDRGKFIICSFCKSNIFSQRSRNYDLVVSLENSYLEDGYDVSRNMRQKITKEFNDLENMGLDIEELQIDNIVDKFGGYGRMINNDNDIMLSGIQYLASGMNKFFSDGLTKHPGSIYRVKGDQIPLGDSPFIGDKPNKLNAFMVGGDIRNPVGFERLVSFQTTKINKFNIEEIKTYTVWRPIPYTDEKGKKIYEPLSDIVQYGTKKPNTNLIACVNKDCLKELTGDTLELLYFHFGYILKESEKSSEFEMNFKINNQSYMFQPFSVWRTPLNNMVVNVGTDESLQDNTLIYNLLNGRPEYLDNNGDVKKFAYIYVTKRLKSISVDKVAKTLIITVYYNTYYAKQIELYFKKNMKYFEKIPEEKRKKLIENKVKNNFEKNKYNIPTKIENCKNMYDLMLILFSEGLDMELIVSDISGGAATNFLVPIQREVLKILKTVFPPNVSVWMIKNECLSYYKVDHERRELIRNVTKVVNRQKKILDIISSDPSKFCKSDDIAINIIRNKDLQLKSYLNHIKNFVYKIDNLELQEFTKDRLQVILEIYQSTNTNLETACQYKDRINSIENIIDAREKYFNIGKKYYNDSSCKYGDLSGQMVVQKNIEKITEIFILKFKNDIPDLDPEGEISDFTLYSDRELTFIYNTFVRKTKEIENVCKSLKQKSDRVKERTEKIDKYKEEQKTAQQKIRDAREEFDKNKDTIINKMINYFKN